MSKSYIKLGFKGNQMETDDVKQDWRYLLDIYVLFGTGLEHSDPHRLPKTRSVLGVHLLPGWVVVFISHWEIRQETFYFYSIILLNRNRTVSFIYGYITDG